MPYRKEVILKKIDMPLLLIYVALVMLGWLTIYAAEFDPQNYHPIIDLEISAGRQLLWIGTSVILITFIMATDYKFFDGFAYVTYLFVVLLLVAVLLVGKEVAGSKSWFGVGNFGIQPSEFAKFATSLALARYLSDPNIRLDRWSDLYKAGIILGIPALLILAQNDTGSTLVFSSFVIVLYREGLTPLIPGLGLFSIFLFIITLLVPQSYIIIGALIFAVLIGILVPKTLKNIATLAGMLALVVVITTGVDYFINKVLQPHQQNRIKVLVNPNIDPLGVGWNVTQSKNAIGSGGFFGKGYLEGTQTKFNFVPEQNTDFIFCTIGEEFGWMGSLLTIGLFMALILRLVYLADRQKLKFSRIYGYCVASIVFFHFMVNLGMTIGLFPVIGIPLPFVSYGGSSLWAFTVLLFIFLKLDAHRSEILSRA
jgi:rod shape determining protein RodA